MADNPYVNKVEYGGNTVMDLTQDTVTPNSLLLGHTAHDKSGAPISGLGYGIIVVGMDENCKYVCDGVADNIQFQAAIDEAYNAGGGIIMVKGGNYTFNTAIHLKSNIELRMSEDTVITLDAQQSWVLPNPTETETKTVVVSDEILDYITVGQAIGFTDGSTGYLTDEAKACWNFVTAIDKDTKTISLYRRMTNSYTTMVTLDSIISTWERLDGYFTNITIKGGVLDGNKDNQPVWIADITHNGIIMGEVQNLLIEGVTVRNVHFQGIHITIRSSEKVDKDVLTTVKNCYLYNTSLGAICIDSSRFVSIEGCEITDSSFGVQIVESSDIYVSNCYTLRNHYGVHMTGNSTHDVLVENCVSVDERVGVNVNGIPNCVINGGIIKNSTQAGIAVRSGSQNVSISGVIITNSVVGILEEDTCENNVACGISTRGNTTNYSISSMSIGDSKSDISIAKLSDSLLCVKDKDDVILGGILPDSSLIDTSANLFDINAVETWERIDGYRQGVILTFKPDTQYTIWGNGPIPKDLHTADQTVYFGDTHVAIEKTGGVKTVTSNENGEIKLWIIQDRTNFEGYMNGTYKLTIVEGTEPLKYVDTPGAPKVAPAFKTSLPYKVGDYVTYEGKTYRFKSDHDAGVWDASHVEFEYPMGAHVTAGKNPDSVLGYKATAEGWYTTASGSASHAEGANNVASGVYSHAEGVNTIASGEMAHAEGSSTVALGSMSHAEGNLTKALQAFTHTEGNSTIATFVYSHAEGCYTKTGAVAQHVQGRFNVGKSDTLFEIGNGTAENARSNALEVDLNGNVVASGTITDGQGNTLGESGDVTFKKVSDSALHILSKSNDILGALPLDTTLLDEYNLFDLTPFQTYTVHFGYDWAAEFNLKPNTSYTLWLDKHSECTVYFGDLDKSVEEFGTYKTLITDETGTVWIWIIGGRTASEEYRNGTYTITLVEGETPLIYYKNYSNISVVSTLPVPREGLLNKYFILKSVNHFYRVNETINEDTNTATYSWEDLGTFSRSYVTAGQKADTTLGNNATAEGNFTTASGKCSHAEGTATTSSGVGSHAEGANSVASGPTSHAEGNGTTASGSRSHAEGSGSKATKSYSHAEGYYTKTGADYQHVQGKWNVGKNNTLFEIGNGTAEAKRSNAFEVDTDGNVLASGTITDGQGHVLGESSGGVNPAPLFDETVAYKVGDYVTYNGNTYQFKAIKEAGVWDSTKVEQEYAMGTRVTSGKKANTTLGIYATAEGSSTTANGNYSHAEGSSTTANGSSAHAEGSSTTANGNYSHTEGCRSTATGYASHAEGQNTTANGNYSHAEGFGTIVNGDYSHVEGLNTQTGANYQHVQGIYNVGKTTTLFEIGNGTANDARSNALEVDTDGNLKATSYSNLSSRKYKKNIENMTEKEARKILELNPVKYDYKSDLLPNNQYGLIAEDVEKIMTYPIIYENEEPDSIDYSKFIPALIKLVQMQQAQIDELIKDK